MGLQPPLQVRLWRPVARGNKAMKSFVRQILWVVALALVTGGVVLAQSAQTNEPLTNASIVKLVRAGFKEKTIISLIDISLTRFDLAPDRMIDLTHSGGSEKAILEMLSLQQGIGFSDGSWSSEPFFNQESSNAQKENQKAGNGGTSADIFGSSGSG